MLGAESDHMDESSGGDHAERMNLTDIAHGGYKSPKQSYLTAYEAIVRVRECTYP
jgi:hypothetical protein